ncbi:patatin-like phospholipase family protein [Roseibium marinum]|uniref:Putative acylesterase/phospholipase RssA n=1 Tax=Roseibium marinum TaxID=281252 RepID=A0A2S3UUT3_9HYPH|nr:patatin-like phospholipase family protein [Roseibium marinum]POF31481.1 putative acylesterase/phospholipase RssA [Roseibium marinum]
MPIGLVLGGGAPNLPLMSGALLALDEAGVEFQVISTTGAGMLAGLLYASPQKAAPDDALASTRRDALKATRLMGIDDLIYHFMPINFKIFQKPGPIAEALAPAFNTFLSSFPRERRDQRLMGDWLSLVVATMMPSNLSTKSKGLCQAPSWIEAMVDFDDLVKNLGETRFRLGAYSVEDRDEITFNREDITIDHCKAALAMPFIYEPYKLRDPKTGEEKTYLEGSAFDPLKLDPDDVMVEHDVDTIIFFDILGHRRLIDEPRDLTDAWVQSIIAPLTRLAENSVTAFKSKRAQHARDRFLTQMDRIMDLAESDPEAFQKQRKQVRNDKELYELVDLLGSADVDLAAFDNRAQAYLDLKPDPELAEFVGLALTDYRAFVLKREAFLKKREKALGGKSVCRKTHSSRSELLRMPFRRHIPEEHWPNVLDWSHSNMSMLFDIGYETGKSFVANHRERLESSMGKTLAGEPELASV